MAKWLFTPRRQIIIFCLLVILVSLVGHFLVDATGFSLDSPVAVDLHGNFLLNSVAELSTPRTAAFIWVLPPALCRYCIAPPTPPPPISSLV